jgi:hypothetical protein
MIATEWHNSRATFLALTRAPIELRAATATGPHARNDADVADEDSAESHGGGQGAGLLPSSGRARRGTVRSVNRVE